jgi:hypothetical protein
MPLAMSLIVAGYVRLRDRDALEKLRVHRITMLEAAKSVAELDNSRMLATLEEEIELISAGLSGLNAGQDERKLAPGGDQEISPTIRDPDRQA